MALPSGLFGGVLAMQVTFPLAAPIQTIHASQLIPPRDPKFASPGGNCRNAASNGCLFPWLTRVDDVGIAFTKDLCPMARSISTFLMKGQLSGNN